MQLATIALLRAEVAEKRARSIRTMTVALRIASPENVLEPYALVFEQIQQVAPSAYEIVSVGLFRCGEKLVVFDIA